MVATMTSDTPSAPGSMTENERSSVPSAVRYAGRCHDSEINGDVSWIYDGVWRVRLGDEGNGLAGEAVVASHKTPPSGYARTRSDASRTANLQDGFLGRRTTPNSIAGIMISKVLLLVFAAFLPLGVSFGQNAPGSPIVNDVPVAGGTERVLFLGSHAARAILVLLPGGNGIIGLDNGGGIHQLGSNFLVRTFGRVPFPCVLCSDRSTR